MAFSLRSVWAAGRTLHSARSLKTGAVRNKSIYQIEPEFKPPTLDEMPVPTGPWLQDYKMKQANYNRQLIAGLVLFVSTVTYIVRSDRFFFNMRLPPFPPAPEEGELSTFTPPSEC